jgi:class 3 adenylate cyclase/tetratricopeptide (TPR) repeat protein
MACSAALVTGSPPREVRKTVTVLFCDVTASTALGESTDPETLRGLLARYFARMSVIVESHGGTVEKFIGDAVMTVFGVPAAHEDDALRACRAAVEMRDALPELGIQGRIGVNTGEVVAGTAERLVTGDAVNVAARLEQAAAPGEVLIGETTYSLVREAVAAEPVEPLRLKGKAEPVPAFRLLTAHAAPERRHDSLFVGRKHELGLLADAWERAVAEQRCELVTVVGDPGIGKSRLTVEVLASIEARVVRGRCLAYGAGITYWPVVEVIKQLNGLPGDPAAAAAIRSLLGESDAGTSTEEIGWAFRKLLEEQAPLVIVFDDIQWGEETFLDLIEHVALLSSGAPLLLLCMARPELLDSRPTWPVTIRLDPLDSSDSADLIGTAVPEELRARIAVAAAGNPLFIREMLAMTQEVGDGVEVPPSLKALLAARLDQLDPADRRVLECGSVEGELFHRGAVQALTPEETQVTPRLVALVRRELIRSDRPQFAGEDGFRFRHLLIRDTAYDALPKSVRADLHQRFAAWLEQHGELVELDEIVGYHLEQAARYKAELGRADPELSREAIERLAAAGRAALWRGDPPSAESLLERAVALSDRPDVHLVVNLAQCRIDLGAAAAALDEAAARAEVDGDAACVALARALAATVRLETFEVPVDEQELLALAAVPVLEAAGDHAGLAEVWTSLAYGAYNARCRYDQMEHAAEQGLLHAGLAGQQRTYPTMLPIALLHGSRPVVEALQRLDALAKRYPHPAINVSRAILLAMSDQISDAQTLADTTEERLRELNLSAFADGNLFEFEQLVGDHEAAAERLRRQSDYLADRGLTAQLSTHAAWHGRVLCALGRYDEAEPLARQGRQLGDENDPLTQSVWRRVAALVAAHRGEAAEAERLAREAVTHTQKTDSPWEQADALSDLAQVLETAGRHDQAAAAYRQALELYERKGIIPLARRTRERLAALRPART